MKLWKVRIHCWMEEEDGERTRIQRIFLVEASDMKSAGPIALEYAEKTAKFGETWVGFEHRETASAQLPIEITR